MLELYTSDGWVNYPSIFDNCPNCWLYVLLGPRQVGKTYGINLEMLERGLHFLYLRRTDKEFQAISASDDLNPFIKYRPEYDIAIAKSGPVTYSIGEYEQGERKKIKVVNERGIGMPLASIANIRGFDGSRFSDIIFDEFIPEKIAIHRKAEGDAMLNAYTTINGNRELEGLPPVRLWLLANAFDIQNPILEAMGLVPLVEKLMRTKNEYIVTRTGVFLAYFKAQDVINKRRETALMKHLRTSKATGTQEFLSMALDNEFAYDHLELVKPQSLQGLQPYIRIGDMYIYHHKNKRLYVCRSAFGVKASYYGVTPTERLRLLIDHPEIRAMYAAGLITFDTVQTYLNFCRALALTDKS